jgi:3-methyladenine DNA glycosylase Tag
LNSDNATTGSLEVYTSILFFKVANCDQRRIEELLTNPSIIRNKLKIQSAITNARAFLKLQQQFGALIHIFGISLMANQSIIRGKAG